LKGGGVKKRVRIRECHLEEDADKMIQTGAVSLLDYNRADMSLLEIVTEPDMESGEEAEIFVQQLHRAVRYLGVCDGNMEEGSLRADANISLNLTGKGLGKKVEIKNLNSSRFIKLGLNYEIKRQAVLLDAVKTITQDTRLWNENRDETALMRTKENAQDYCYFPEPDLSVFTPDEAFLKSVDTGLVELPLPHTRRVMADYGLNDEQVFLICEEKALADYYENAVEVTCKLGLEKKDASLRIVNRLLSDVKHILSRDKIDPANTGSIKLTPCRLVELTEFVAGGKISNKNAKQALEAVFTEDKYPVALIKEHDWEQINDPTVISNAIKQVWKAETVASARATMDAGS
jgi:aspartyl-tRNA(Asn)/glutamyl-tRNA(Gln) amidotransferase subunit B